MLFFDIDGTLLDEKEGIVPESTVRALHQAKKNGHLLFLCTGRCKSIWPKDILEIGFDGVVGGCGTNIFYSWGRTASCNITERIAERSCQFSDALSYRWCFGRSGDGIFSQRLLDAGCEIHL